MTPCGVYYSNIGKSFRSALDDNDLRAFQDVCQVFESVSMSLNKKPAVTM